VQQQQQRPVVILSVNFVHCYWCRSICVGVFFECFFSLNIKVVFQSGGKCSI
jgi:hypothetical protein